MTHTLQADITLLELETAAATPVILSGGRSALAGVTASVFCWGVDLAGYTADHLQQAELPAAQTASCHDAYARIGNVVTNEMLCAGLPEGGIDTCTGDSGGPLVLWDTDEDRWVQIGVISWGKGCAEPGFYDVYTDVAAYGNWIDFQLFFYGAS